MTLLRYIGLIWDVTDPSGKEKAARCGRLMEGSDGWDRVAHIPGLQVYCRGGRGTGSMSALPLARESGVVLGTVFGSDCVLHNPNFSEAETDAIIESQGRSLLDSYWGRYVGFVADASRRTVWVVKDPTGRLPCFATQRDGLTVVFSYMPDCIRLGVVRVNINWNFIAARIALGCGRPDDTGIENVTELCGGECLELRQSQCRRHLYWNPGKLFNCEIIEDPARLAPLIRKTARTCTNAWASQHKGFVHQLSGGLDSSIVLSCLADAPSRPNIVCLTYYRSQGPSDERPWARLAAQRTGVQHIEHSRSEFMDFSALAGMNPCASPPLTHSFLEIDELEHRLANQHQATAISSGDGGDSLFGSTSARFSVLDYARRRGLRPELLRIASNVALSGNKSVWTVLSKSLRYRFSNQDAEDINHLRDARALASPEIREPILASKRSFAHPWFRSGHLPHGASEILSFLTLPDLFYPPLGDLDEDIAERVYPLLSQPLVELCVSIPSYLHFDEGRDRGLVRRAFSGDVPAPILDRTWKDPVQGFPEDILRANLPYFRQILLDGILVKERYLDRAALEMTLSGQILKGTASVGEILDHVLVEAWLRSWMEQRSRLAA